MSETITFYHNPRCSKSRTALGLLQAEGIEPTIVRYLDEGLTVDTLSRLIDLLGGDEHMLLRKKEAAYQEAGLSPESDRKTIIHAICEHPILLERPVAVCGDKAVIGRPPENVLGLL